MAEIEDWKERTKKLEAALSSYSRLEMDKKAADDRHQQQVKQNEEMKYYVSKLENDINGYRKNEGLLKDLEKNNAMLTKEIERLNGNLKNQAGELNDFRVRYSKIESSLNEYKNIEEKLRDYQNKIALLTTEMERLNDLLKDRNKEISQLENEKLEIYQQISYYKNYESKIGEKDQIIAKNNETINALKRDIENWQIKTRDADTKARELENTLFRASQEKEKLGSMIKLKNSEYEELRGQYSRLEPEMRRKNELEIAFQEQQVPAHSLRTRSWAACRTSTATSAN
jgi:chromosome segregation ATPase